LDGTARQFRANIGSAPHKFIVVATSFISSRPTKVLVVVRAPAATMLACLTKPNPSSGTFGAKIAQAAAGRISSNIASRQQRRRRVNNRKSFSFSSEAFACVRITHRHQKEAQPEGQHDDIQHEVLLVALVSERDGCAFRERRLRWIKSNKSLVAPNSSLARCGICFRVGCYGNVIGSNKCRKVLT
jgi:hypothetical protein